MKPFQLCLLCIAIVGFLSGSGAGAENAAALFNRVYKEEGTVAPPEMPALLQRLHTALSESGDALGKRKRVEAMIEARILGGDQCKENSSIELRVLIDELMMEAKFINSGGPQVINSNAVAYLKQCVKDRIEFCAGLVRASVKAAASGLISYEDLLVTLRDKTMAGVVSSRAYGFETVSRSDVVKGIVGMYGGGGGEKISSERLAEIKEEILGICEEVDDEFSGIFQVHQIFLNSADEFTRQWIDIGRICRAISTNPKSIFAQVKESSR